MAEGPVFERNLGSDGSHGINFEWETTLLTYLRCEKLHQHWKKNNDTGVKSFFVANNVKGVGAFDDVVVRVVYVLEGEVKTKLLFCQCKHVTDATKIDKFQNYLGPKEIQKYFDSFLKVYKIFAGDKISDFKQNTKQCDSKKYGEEIETQMKLKSLFNCTFEECELLFLSNIESLPSNTTSFYRIQPCFQKSELTTHLFPGAIGNEYHLNSEWCLKNLKCDNTLGIIKENLITEFCKRLRVFLNQDDKMYIHINSAIKDYCGKNIDDIDLLRDKMQDETKLIFDANSKCCIALTENNNLLGKIMGFLELKKSSEKELKHYRQKLKLSSKDAKMEISEKLSGSWIYIPSRFPKIEKLKIFRTLIDLGYENVCLILNDKEDVEKLELARRSQTYMQEKTVFVFIQSNIKWDRELKHNEIFVKIDKSDEDHKNRNLWIPEISDETKHVIENSNINIQGHETKMGNFCYNWKDILDEQTICRILESDDIVIGSNLPLNPDCYVDRRFKMKVITEELMMKFGSLITDECKNKILLFSEKFDMNNGSDYICNIFETIQDVRSYICKLRDLKYIFYCFSYFKDKLEFRYTCGTQSISLDEKIVDEEYLVNYNGEQKIALLNDIAGMGKSTTMLALAMRYKEINKSHFVYFIELNKYGSIFDSEDVISNTAEATHFVATKLLNLKGIEYDMFINACFVTGSVAIFFDAYDELSEPGQKITSALIAELESTNIARIIVSSRPKCAYDLEKIFLIKSFEFLELLSVERERCLFEYWKKMMKHEVKDEQHLKQNVNKIICSLETKANILNELLATPLQIKMISNAYFKTMMCVYKNEVENTCIEIDVINLYDKYVHSHVEHYFEVKFGGNWTNWDKEKRDREIQGKLKGALEFGCGIVVPDLEIQILNRDNVLQALHNDLGLITNMDPPVFIHRTVSEYLAAKYIVTEVFSKQNDQKTTSIIELILKHTNFDVLRKFINLILQGEAYPKYFENIVMNVNILRKWIPDETALHVAASEGNTELLKALLQRESILIDIRNNNGNTSFHIACLSGNTEAAKILLSTKNCSVDTVDRYGNSPLHDATKNGSVEIIERILRVNISDLETNQSSFQKVFSKHCTEKSKLINCQNKDGYTSMHLAVQLNLVEAVKLLLEDHLFNMNILDKDDNSVFHWAARTGSIKIMQLFLEYNETQHNITTENTSLHMADSKRKIVAKILNQKNKYDQTPLHLAVYYGHIDAVEFLIKHNCSLNERDNNGESVLHLATERKHIKIMTMLLHCDPTLIHQRNNQQKIPLHTACYLGCTEAVELLIKYNCSVKERDRFGKTALHMAVNGNYVDTLEKLLQKDCSTINQKNAFGETAFLYACACGSTDAVELLIKYNCSMNDQDMNGNTALHAAAKENRVQIINQILLKCHPSFVNQKNSAGNTAMYFACLHGANDAVELLIKHDSSVNERDRYGDTLLHLATEKNHVKIMENLLKHSPSLLNLQNNNGESALHLACNKGHTDAVKFLLANECAVDTTDRGNKTALHHASKWGRRNIVVLLLENNCSIIDLKDGGNKTALNYASQSGYVEIEKILKEKGASNENYIQRCIIL